MKKLKIVLALTVTVCFVLLWASMPKLMASVMDGVDAAVQYKDAPAAEAGGDSGLTLLQKMSLCAHGESIDVSPMNAKRTEEEIVTSVTEFLSACEEMGCYIPFQTSSVQLTTKLVYSVEDNAKAFLLWSYYACKRGPVAGLLEEGETKLVELLVDDQTGKILYIYSERYNGTYNAYRDTAANNRARTAKLTDLYFSQLGLQDLAEKAEALPGALYYCRELANGVTDTYYAMGGPGFDTFYVFVESGCKDVFLITLEKQMKSYG